MSLDKTALRDEDGTLAALFQGFDVTGRDSEPPQRNVALPLTDFVPPLHFPDVHAIARLMVEAVPSWDGVTAIAGLADRSAGSVIHVMSQLTGIPYTLANWYPKGSRGAIFVHEAVGFSGPGVILFNGIEKGQKVVFADIVIRGGTLALGLVEALVREGVDVQHAVFGADFSDRQGMKRITASTRVPCTAVGTIVVDDDDAPQTIFKRNLLPGRVAKRSHIPTALTPSRPLELQPRAIVEQTFRRVLDMFTGIPVYFAEGSSYPYSNFSLTDFDPIMDSARIEDMADCMCLLSPTLRPYARRQAAPEALCNNDVLIVSESDRGGGPLAVALSRRTGLPFTMANWSASVGDTGGVKSSASVGYSGQGALFLNGVTKGTKVIIVDDMLSSGGTARSLIKCVEAAGGDLLECLFASEKSTTKGRENLAKDWPRLPLYTLCYFSSSSDCTIAVPPTPLGHDTPVQAKSDSDPAAGSRREREK